MQAQDRKIIDIINEGRFTISTEIVPPRNGAGPAAIMSQISQLSDAGAEFMSVTKGAGGSLRGGSLPIAQTIKERFALPCIAHFTCRDLSPEEVENQLIDHHFFGIRNILALRGDPPQGIKDWVPREGSYPFAYQLAEQIRLLNEGKYLERKGYAVDAREQTDFCVGVACYPDHPIADERIAFFKRKVEAGAEYAISQMLFDHESYARFLDECERAGCAVPIIPGTRLLKSREQAEKMAKRFEIPIPEWYRQLLPATDADATPEHSLNAFSILTEKFKAAGAPGLHIFVLSDTALASQALSQLAKPKAALYAVNPS
jgi:methylenetetrahydrofolate reductase (NADPH)